MGKIKSTITRKEALKTLGGLALGLPTASNIISNTPAKPEPVHAAPGKKQASPNILFIIDDQHRGDFLGAAGAEWLLTPNLDKLAGEGVMFSKAYASTPSCTPSRTAILTGLAPWNHGMLGYMNSIAQYYWCTMPQFFTQQGHHTVSVGKNHFGPPRNTNGFITTKLEESFYSYEEKGFKCDYQSWFQREAPGYNINATGLSYNDNRGNIPYPYEDRFHATHWTAQQAIDFLEESRADAPWFLKVSFQRPHPPFDPPKRWMDYYKNVQVPMPEVGQWAKERNPLSQKSMNSAPEAAVGHYSDEEVRASREAYAGSISFVDEHIGRIISALKKTGQYENTLILFTSDHGEMLGDHYMWRKCRPYEPSAHVPMILRWPASLGLNAKRGQVREELVEMRDIFPTFADACRFVIPVNVDGKSMLSILQDADTWRKTLELEHSIVYKTEGAWVALTDGRYKYIYYTLTGEEQLFDLADDPKEMQNIVHRPGNELLHEKWYNEMVKYLEVRGPAWVKANKLQIQEKSLLVGDKFPLQSPDQRY